MCTCDPTTHTVCGFHSERRLNPGYKNVLDTHKEMIDLIESIRNAYEIKKILPAPSRTMRVLHRIFTPQGVNSER